jgi:hypothetical protein
MQSPRTQRALEVALDVILSELDFGSVALGDV